MVMGGITMKRIVNLSVVLSAVFASSVWGASNGTVPITAERMYVPLGFDDNDPEVSVVLEGYLRSSCYKLIATEIDVNHVNKTIALQPRARKFEGPCTMALVHYWTPVNISEKTGLLPYGDYKVTVRNQSLSSVLTVRESTNAGPDDHIYAPVDKASVAFDSKTKSYWATVRGLFTNTCMQWDGKPRFEVQGNTVLMLPILKDFDAQAPGCEPDQKYFSERFELPELAQGHYLLHVRSLNGHAENDVFPVLDRGDPADGGF